MSYKAQLDAILKQRGIGGSSFGFSNPFSMPTFDSVGSVSWLKIGGYALGILLILLLVLTVVHFTITPIFRLKSGSQGIITIPGISTADDGAIYWDSNPHTSTLNEQETIFENSTITKENYSLCIDFLFIDLSAGTIIDSGQPVRRPLLLRYNPANGPDRYSLGMFLDASVNDLEVRVRTTNNDIATVVLKNVPAKTPIRVGVCVYPTYFEVYRNGLIVGTKTLSNKPSESIGEFWSDVGKRASAVAAPPAAAPPAAAPPASTCTTSSGGEGILGYSMNLHLWRRTLAANEMQFSTPNMPTAPDFIPGAKASALQGYIDTGRNNLMVGVQGLETNIGAQLNNLRQQVQQLGA